MNTKQNWKIHTLKEKRLKFLNLRNKQIRQKFSRFTNQTNSEKQKKRYQIESLTLYPDWELRDWETETTGEEEEAWLKNRIFGERTNW